MLHEWTDSCTEQRIADEKSLFFFLLSAYFVQKYTNIH